MAVLYSKISRNGQIVIPAELRKALGLRPRTRIALQRDGNAIVLIPVNDEFIESIPGSLKGPSLGALREREHR